MKIPYRPDHVDAYTIRYKVINGWIVHNYSGSTDEKIHKTTVFVPDEFHVWEIDRNNDFDTLDLSEEE